MNSLNIFLDDITLLDKSLKEVNDNYRSLDPGWYLYRKLCFEKDINKKFEDDFMELVYVTLSAWNMNSRGAKLSDFQKFRESIRSNKESILKLSKYKINNFSETEFDDVVNISEYLFKNLNLVATDKPRLVTFSKTLHFLLPDLVVPIDRTYTLKFFYNNTNVDKDLNLQFQKFSSILNECLKFTSKTRLDLKLNASWNQNIPKIIDNIIIGYSKIKRKEVLETKMIASK